MTNTKIIMQESHTREELLQNTVNHFNSNNRSEFCMNEHSSICKYRSGNKGCAIGRELTDELAYELDDLNCGFVSEPEVFNLLPERLQMMKSDYLKSIQELHDNKIHWDENGLSRRGKDVANNIINLYKLNTQLYI